MEDKSPRKVIAGRVDILTHNFYDWDGKQVLKGGAERYIYDLAVLLKNMGYQVRIVQGANRDFEKEYRGVMVVGVSGVTPGVFASLSKRFRGFCREAEFVIASPNELAVELGDIPCIGINHGINFDSEAATAVNAPEGNYKLQIESLCQMRKCVAVDTNFGNWVRTRRYSLCRKIKYIPNYFDEKVFSRSQKAQNEKVVFVYPRRIYTARGYDITLEAFRKILPKYRNVELRMVGAIDNETVKADIDNMINDFPEQVQHHEYVMEDMHKAYEGVDVVLVPTKYSEGTSLSCIEAQAQGIPVIVTDVGGLPNLVVNGYNGLMIAPTVADLVEAVETMIKNPEMRKKMGKRSYEIAHNALTKKIWEERWRNVIKEMSAEVAAKKGE